MEVDCTQIYRSLSLSSNVDKWKLKGTMDQKDQNGSKRVKKIKKDPDGS